jgi:hypothetical protein
VGLLHGLLEPFNADVGVNLGCREALVTEKLLNSFQISAAVKEMGRE